jgi:hypothetical protein
MCNTFMLCGEDAPLRQIESQRQTPTQREAAPHSDRAGSVSGSRPFNRLRSRARLIAAACGSFVAVALSAAAMSAPAQAAAAQASTVCHPEGVGWSSAPFSATLTGTICDSGGTGGNGSCPGGPRVDSSIAWWADPFVSVTKITDGCYHITTYGGAESMWTNISVKVTDPLEPWDAADGTVWLRIAMTSNGTTYKQAGASMDLTGALAGLLGEL